MSLLPIGCLVIRVAVRPSFAPPTEIELRDRGRPTRAEDYYLLVTDGAEKWEAPIERSEVTRLLGMIETARIPLAVEGHFGLDGVGYELGLREEAGEMSCACTFHWWSAAPAGWEVFGEIVETLVGLARMSKPPGSGSGEAQS